MRALNLILVCVALGAYGCDNSATRQESPAAHTEAQPGTGSIAAVEVREPEPPPPGFTQEVFTFKGIPLGKPDTRPLVRQLCEETEQIIGTCKAITNESRPYILFSLNYGPPSRMGSDKVPGVFRFADDDTGTLESVKLQGPQTYIEELAVALTTKYGAPMAASAELQNLYGAKSDSQLFAWQDPDGNHLVLISLDPNTIRPGYGSAVFKSANFLAKEAQTERARKDAAADNL